MHCTFKSSENIYIVHGVDFSLADCVNVICHLQLSSDDVSASLGEESLQDDREDEQLEIQQSPHPAGAQRYLLQLTTHTFLTLA